MKLAILSALALSIAAPAFADAKDVERHFAQDNLGIESVVFEGSAPLTQRAADIFAELALEAGTGIETRTIPQVGVMTLSSKGGVNATAQRIFAEMLAAENGPDR